MHTLGGAFGLGGASSSLPAAAVGAAAALAGGGGRPAALRRGRAAHHLLNEGVTGRTSGPQAKEVREDPIVAAMRNKM